jgi:hypothetical protein
MEGIPLSDCKDRFLYRIHSRNLSLGVFNVNNAGFIGIREKFGHFYLFTEYHYDTGATVRPEKELEPVPEGMSLEERLGTIDEKTGQPVDFDKPVSEGGRGWYYLDTNKSSSEIRPVSVPNTALFKWLKEKEGHYKL